MKKFITLTLSLIGLGSFVATAQHNTKIHVSINGNDTGSTGLIGAPFRKIQTAINYSLDGDTIIVHPGRYKENLLVDAKDIFLYSEFQSNKDSSLLYNTIMDGDSMANTLILRDFNGELNGFTIERGVSNYGAGLYVMSSNNPIIRNCIIQKNRGYGDITGHGVVLKATNGLMENCIIRDNWGSKWTVEIGGWSTFRNCDVYSNTALGGGSNLIIVGAANVYNVLVHHNNGGGMEVRFINSPDTANIRNVTIVNNSYFGLWIMNSYVRISNSIIYGNDAKNILLENTIAPNKTQLEIDYCIVGGGADSVLTNVYKVLTYGTHNINALPRFKSDWDFHLNNTSPAIGKGKNVVSFSNFSHTVFPFDYDGNPRPNPIGSTPDIGAYESTLGTPIDTSCNYIFTTMPSSASKPKGANHIFNSFHNGNYSYQWQADAAGLGWQNVSNMNQYSGANGNNLTVNNISVSNHNQRFRVIAFKTGCADTSDVANLQVTDTCLTTVTDTLIIKTTVGLPTPNITNTLLIYPNPAYDRITIDNGNYTAMAGYSIKIENALGQQVFSSAINQAQFTVDLSTWTGKGIYYVRLLDAQGKVVTIRKILLQ
jgi:hypothetical protein